MPKFCVKIDIDLCIVREGSTFSGMTLIYFLRLVQYNKKGQQNFS